MAEHKNILEDIVVDKSYQRKLDRLWLRRLRADVATHNALRDNKLTGVVTFARMRRL